LSPPYPAGDRLTVRYINTTLGRLAPAFQCPAWDGSDACCNPEKGGNGDDVRYVTSVVDAITTKYNVDTSRIYLMGRSCATHARNHAARGLLSLKVRSL